jgi:hypothetical protein
MAFPTLTWRNAQDIIDGTDVPGRDDLGWLYAVAAWLRASGENEPPPPMSADLVRQIELGTPPAN